MRRPQCTATRRAVAVSSADAIECAGATGHSRTSRPDRMSAANARLNLMLPPEVASERQYPTPAGGWQGVRAARALLVVLVAVLFHSALLGRGVFYYRDIGLFWHPQVEAFVRTVAAGSWPVWNPYVGFGRPLLANPNVQVFYPPTWLNLL